MPSGFPGGSSDELWAMRREAERRNAEWMRANMQVEAIRRTATVSGASAPDHAGPAAQQNSITAQVPNPHIPAVGPAPTAQVQSPNIPPVGAAPNAQVQSPQIHAVGPAARLGVAGGAPPIMPQGAPPVVGSPTWGALGSSAAGVNPGGRVGAPALAGIAPNAAAPGNAAFGFGGESRHPPPAPQGGGGGNIRGNSLDQSAHLELEMLRLEKERERLLLEQEVEMLRLENEIRERGMQLMQREAVLGGAGTTAPVAAALYAGAVREGGAAAARVPAMLNNLLDGGDNRGGTAARQAAPGQSRAALRASEVIELDDSSDEDEGKGNSRDAGAVVSCSTEDSFVQPVQAEVSTGDRSKANSGQHTQVRNAAAAGGPEKHAASTGTQGSPVQRVQTDNLTEKGVHGLVTNAPLVPGGNEPGSIDKELRRKGSGKKRSVDKAPNIECDDKDDNLSIRNAYKKRKKEANKEKRSKDRVAATLEPNLRWDSKGGGASKSKPDLPSNQGDQHGNKNDTETSSFQSGTRVSAKQASGAESDDDSVVIMEAVDEKSPQEGAGQPVPASTNAQMSDSNEEPSVETQGQCAKVTIQAARSQSPFVRPAPTETMHSKEMAGARAQAKAVNPQDEAGQAQEAEQLEKKSAKNVSQEQPAPTSTASPSAEAAIDQHCQALQNGILQLQERMERLEAYATHMNKGEADGGQPSSSVPGDQCHVAKKIEELQKENQGLREKAQKASSYWREKCQERELKFCRIFSEMEEHFKKKATALHEKHKIRFQQEREKYQDILKTGIEDDAEATKKDLEGRVASATLEAQALSNAMKKMDLYGNRELEAFTQRLQTECEVEREFHCLQKEELRSRIERVGREDKYFCQRATREVGRSGSRSQTSRPLPSDVLGNNMIYLLMRDLANLEYMADFLRKKMRQEVVSEDGSGLETVIVDQ